MVLPIIIKLPPRVNTVPLFVIILRVSASGPGSKINFVSES